MSASTSTPDHDLLISLSSTPVDQTIPSDKLATALSSPPFLTTAVKGSMNLRDIGAFAPAYLKTHTVYRSGLLDFIPQASLTSLNTELGVSHVYDFRRDQEVRRPLDGDNAVPGLEVVRCPYCSDEEWPALVAENFAPLEDGSVGRGYRDMYDVILRGHATGYRKVFETLKSAKKGDAVLFHCTGGKDRTGVMAAILLDLMGAPTELIAQDYALTRVGIEPFRERLLPVALKALDKSSPGWVVAAAGVLSAPPGESGEAAATNEAELRKQAEAKMRETPGMFEFLSTDAAVMVDFLGHVRKQYGGAEGYLKSHLGFGEVDIRQIRDNLRPESA